MDEFTALHVQKAQRVLKNVATHTPLQYDYYLSQKYQAQIYLKREDLQKDKSLYTLLV